MPRSARGRKPIGRGSYALRRARGGYTTPMDQVTLRREARRKLREDPERAGARAHFRAIGIAPDRLDGPIVGIASTWTGTMPCNLNLLGLSDRVAEAVTAAGGVALAFNTLAV